jgi:hypothetical protein
LGSDISAIQPYCDLDRGFTGLQRRPLRGARPHRLGYLESLEAPAPSLVWSDFVFRLPSPYVRALHSLVVVAEFRAWASWSVRNHDDNNHRGNIARRARDVQVDRDSWHYTWSSHIAQAESTKAHVGRARSVMIKTNLRATGGRS